MEEGYHISSSCSSWRQTRSYTAVLFCGYEGFLHQPASTFQNFETRNPSDYSRSPTAFADSPQVSYLVCLLRYLECVGFQNTVLAFYFSVNVLLFQSIENYITQKQRGGGIWKIEWRDNTNSTRNRFRLANTSRNTCTPALMVQCDIHWCSLESRQRVATAIVTEHVRMIL
jgi:hypothetical protein